MIKWLSKIFNSNSEQGKIVYCVTCEFCNRTFNTEHKNGKIFCQNNKCAAPIMEINGNQIRTQGNHTVTQTIYD